MEDETRTFDYGSLADAAHFLAELLGERGVDAGTRVGVLTSSAIDTTITLCALSRLEASAALVDVTASPSYIHGRLRSVGVEYLLADVDHELILDEILLEARIDDLPTVVAEEYALAHLAAPVAAQASDMVFLEGMHPPTVLGWGEIVAVARSIAAKRGVDARSTLTVPAHADRPGTVAALFAGLSVGAAVHVGTGVGRTKLDGEFMHEEKDEQ